MDHRHTARGRCAAGMGLSLMLFFVVSKTKSHADPRVFTDAKGREIIAEIVSARGDTVELNMDGKTFKTPISLLSTADQKFIRKWMQDNPAKIDYHLDFKVEKKQIERDTMGSGYERKTHGKYTYRITVTNRSREEAIGLTLKYRAFMIDRVTGTYFSIASKPETVQKDGQVELPALKLNLSAEFDTEPFDMEETHYWDTTRLIKDEFIGILIRVFDAGGNIVADHREGSTALKTKDWEEKTEGGGATVKPLGS